MLVSCYFLGLYRCKPHTVYPFYLIISGVADHFIYCPLFNATPTLVADHSQYLHSLRIVQDIGFPVADNIEFLHLHPLLLGKDAR